MNSDIFDLKIGKEIYHVDYDHTTGKFTDKQTIEPADNIIVCGLHSLYTKDENLYDLKIYIDTQEDLKTYWKINRDIKERGHSVEKIVKQIESRRGDYKKFIYPQRENSDLVINFYYKDLENTNFNELEMSLKLYIKNSYDIEYIIKKLDGINIKVNVKLEGKFYIIDFEKYKKINSDDNFLIPKLNNFYDYIIFIIINLKKLNL